MHKNISILDDLLLIKRLSAAIPISSRFLLLINFWSTVFYFAASVQWNLQTLISAQSKHYFSQIEVWTQKHHYLIPGDSVVDLLPCFGFLPPWLTQFSCRTRSCSWCYNTSVYILGSLRLIWWLQRCSSLCHPHVWQLGYRRYYLHICSLFLAKMVLCTTATPLYFSVCLKNNLPGFQDRLLLASFLNKQSLVSLSLIGKSFILRHVHCLTLANRTE